MQNFHSSYLLHLQTERSTSCTASAGSEASKSVETGMNLGLILSY